MHYWFTVGPNAPSLLFCGHEKFHSFSPSLFKFFVFETELSVIDNIPYILHILKKKQLQFINRISTCVSRNLNEPWSNLNKHFVNNLGEMRIFQWYCTYLPRGGRGQLQVTRCGGRKRGHSEWGPSAANAWCWIWNSNWVSLELAHLPATFKLITCLPPLNPHTDSWRTSKPFILHKLTNYWDCYTYSLRRTAKMLAVENRETYDNLARLRR